MASPPQTLRPDLPSTLHILRLDPIHCPPPHLSSIPIPHTYHELPSGPLTPTTLISHLLPAHILITTRYPLPSGLLSQLPNLRHIAILAIGSDHIDVAYCHAHGISISNVPAANHEAVSEHALGLYFALRRNVVGMHERCREGREWVEKGTLMGEFWGGLPGGLRSEKVGIIGGGLLGTRVANLCRALSMDVSISDRKPTSTTPSTGTNSNTTPPPHPERTPFPLLLRQSTVLFLTVPLTPSTTNLIGTTELSTLRRDCIIINVSRGGIVNDSDLVDALKNRTIAGAATDVFLQEPAGPDDVLVRAAREGGLGGRLVLSPHVAWCGLSSVAKLRRVVGENMGAWCRGEEMNLVV